MAATLTSNTIRVQTIYGKKDWGIWTGKSELKFEKIAETVQMDRFLVRLRNKKNENESFDYQMRNLKLEIIDT